MPCQLTADCLNEIFKYLEQDKITLHSCLLVNRLWCEVSIRILWRDIWDFKYTVARQYQSDVLLKILDTLIACLPNESKELLHKNKIFTSASTSKLPLFNYASFCKVLSISEIDQMILYFLVSQKSTTLRNLIYNKYLVLQEILKMFMKRIFSLKELKYNSTEKIANVNFTYFPGAISCLTDLKTLSCGSNSLNTYYSEACYQLSQICHNIQSLTIEFESAVSNGLKDLISSQKNLKHLTLIQPRGSVDWNDIIPSLKKHSNTLIKLKIDVRDNYHRSGLPYGSLSFIAIFTNLQELNFSFNNYELDFMWLQSATFPRLQILKFPFTCPKCNYLIQFLKNNGENLREFHISYSHKSLILSIIKYCPNLKSLITIYT